jgi:putative phosphoesterase
MKIGLISDVHAYLEPLQKALAIFDAAGVDLIVCAGDVVDGGYDGDDVVQWIQDRNIDCVLGNHDREAFVSQAWLRKHFTPAQKASASRMLISSQTVGYVSAFPLTRYYLWEGYTVCLAHGTPLSNMLYLFPESTPERFQEVVDAAQADIIILGHTHVVMDIRFGDVRILNPGALCGSRLDHENRTCAILTLPEFKFEVWDVDMGTCLSS